MTCRLLVGSTGSFARSTQCPASTRARQRKMRGRRREGRKPEQSGYLGVARRSGVPAGSGALSIGGAGGSTLVGAVAENGDAEQRDSGAQGGDLQWAQVPTRLRF